MQNIVDGKNKIAELKINEKEKERSKRVQKIKLSLEPVRKSLRMQNIDAETGLQSKKEPSYDLSNSNKGDHHFVFGNDSLEVLGLENLCEGHDTASNQTNPIQNIWRGGGSEHF